MQHPPSVTKYPESMKELHDLLNLAKREQKQWAKFAKDVAKKMIQLRKGK
ncbi:MAG: hypothetical protein WC776_05025 [Patescibacteria group bacterium]|jgi:hypothetical protein